ncbi:retrovirus-related pol polyprotein from transposon TNT 1-94 [Tanacetum coccineum]|uniref:Retrovirus-related pol polyprotein from transposon TNT 1-94 n=1 Tax=Tanacetum coccineum TaxID=301880 RepID=A0ABQ5GKG5_9ASTR
MYRNKLDENGIVSINKARLVAQGYNQQETYAPVARLEYIRILISIACPNDFKLHQMDVKSAFINGFINEEVYVAQPLDFIEFEKPNYVYKLKKALYGLKQAPKARREERSLNNNSFLGEYECSSLALDREERRDEKKRLDHLKQDQTMLVIKRFSERKKVFRERKKTGKIRAKRLALLRQHVNREKFS